MQYFTHPLASTMPLYIGKEAGENLVPEADDGENLYGVREGKCRDDGMYSMLFCNEGKILFEGCVRKFLSARGCILKYYSVYLVLL